MTSLPKVGVLPAGTLLYRASSSPFRGDFFSHDLAVARLYLDRYPRVYEYRVEKRIDAVVLLMEPETKEYFDNAEILTVPSTYSSYTAASTQGLPVPSNAPQPPPRYADHSHFAPKLAALLESHLYNGWYIPTGYLRPEHQGGFHTEVMLLSPSKYLDVVRYVLGKLCQHCITLTPH
jgi:hypothetical protein